ncbi:MAG: cytochrome c [Ferruginibacter sp.]
MKKQLLTGLLLVFTTIVAANDSIDAGKTLFTSRCGNCHKVNEVFVGPALAGVETRRSIDWIIKFVHSSQTMVKEGDKDAVALFTKFKIPMPDQQDLSNDDIKNIVAFIEEESKSASTAIKTPFAKPIEKHPAFVPVSFAENKGFLIALLFSLGLLIGTLFFWAKVKKYERTQIW